MPLYEEFAASDVRKRVALIEVPPFGKEGAGAGSACVAGRLATDREWFVQTPVEIRLRDGVVESASTELPGIRSVARHSVSYVGNWSTVGGLE